MAMDTRDRDGARREKTAFEYASDVWQGFVESTSRQKLMACAMAVVAVATLVLIPTDKFPEE